MQVDFQGIAPVSEGGVQEGPRPLVERGPRSAFGAPSAELSLGGLRPRRARFRFTRRRDDSQHDPRRQGQCRGIDESGKSVAKKWAFLV